MNFVHIYLQNFLKKIVVYVIGHLIINLIDFPLLSSIRLIWVANISFGSVINSSSSSCCRSAQLLIYVGFQSKCLFLALHNCLNNQSKI
ncbi:unnamed protein product [Paramecium primaurelia]|uniref:Uncharacterized protein n=1 Tax=Paramecium primaurelia TaxID=5886 RepID=A0A8S1NT49_PARPR|nr:unnamed protein product [Paramecium primaurelia]